MLYKNVKYPVGLLFTSLFLCCSAPKPLVINEPVSVVNSPKVEEDHSKTDAFMEELLSRYPEYFGEIQQKRKEWNVQIIYTQVNRGANGIPALKNYYFNVNADRYFYPASAISLPLSLLSLQRLNELQVPGLDINTTMITEADDPGETAVFNNPQALDGRPSLAGYLKNAMVVKDNDAGSRLYEFLGQQYINSELQKKGYPEVQILHRLDLSLSADENRHTNPINFLAVDNSVLYQQASQYNSMSFQQRRDSLGNASIEEGKLVNHPMDFSYKNRIGLEDLHHILTGLVFPTKVTAARRFNLSETDRRFILKSMSQFPAEGSYSPYKYDTTKYASAFGKYLLFGAKQNDHSPAIRIFNQSGKAFGGVCDIAYIVDFDKKVEFMLSAIIHCNNTGIINADQYDYEKNCMPFLQHLGQVFYDYEVARPKKILPDLSAVRFDYNQ